MAGRRLATTTEMVARPSAAVREGGRPPNPSEKSLARKCGEEVLAWQAAVGCKRLPNRYTGDSYERSLGARFAEVLRRRFHPIGAGQQPSQQQLSADDLRFINAMPGVPLHGCSVDAGLSSSAEADLPMMHKPRSPGAVDLVPWASQD